MENKTNKLLLICFYVLSWGGLFGQFHQPYMMKNYAFKQDVFEYMLQKNMSGKYAPYYEDHYTVYVDTAFSHPKDSLLDMHKNAVYFLSTFFDSKLDDYLKEYPSVKFLQIQITHEMGTENLVTQTINNCIKLTANYPNITHLEINIGSSYLYYDSIPSPASEPSSIPLKKLYINANFKQFPTTVFKCKKLEQLYVLSDSLESIPNHFGQLKELKHLQISGLQYLKRKSRHWPYNFLAPVSFLGEGSYEFTKNTYKFHDYYEMFDEAPLQYCNRFNSNTASLPISLGKLKKLEKLVLYNAKVDALPPELLGELPNLQYLFLSLPQLQTFSVEDLKEHKKLRYLLLYNIPALESIAFKEFPNDLHLCLREVAPTTLQDTSLLNAVKRLHLFCDDFEQVDTAFYAILGSIPMLRIIGYVKGSCSTLEGDLYEKHPGEEWLKLTQTHPNARLASSIFPRSSLQILHPSRHYLSVYGNREKSMGGISPSDYLNKTTTRHHYLKLRTYPLVFYNDVGEEVSILHTTIPLNPDVDLGTLLKNAPAKEVVALQLVKFSARQLPALKQLPQLRGVIIDTMQTTTAKTNNIKVLKKMNHLEYLEIPAQLFSRKIARKLLKCTQLKHVYLKDASSEELAFYYQFFKKINARIELLDPAAHCLNPYPICEDCSSLGIYKNDCLLIH